jgi:ubiquinone biosynthesis protein COQ9
MTEKAQKTTKERVVAKALEMAAQQGWENTGLADIARESGLSLAELHDHFEDKSDIIAALGRIIDRKVLESVGAMEEGVSPRDRLFHILMERYDALNEYRAGLVAVLNSFKPDPKQAVIALPHLCRSMTWMLEAAGIDTNGIGGALRVAGLSVVYIKGLHAWMDDDSADLAKVMAVLDKDLSRAEKIANNFSF